MQRKLCSLLKRAWELTSSLLFLFMRPVVHQWAFIVMFFLLISPDMFVGFSERYMHPRGWLMLYRTCAEGFLYAYLLASLIYWTRSKCLKVALYCLGFVLFGFNIVLRVIFSKEISPDIFVLLSETNAHEASDCFKVFFLSVGGVNRCF